MVDPVLKELLTKGLSDAFVTSRLRLGEKNILGYGLLTHDTADSLCPIVASKTGAENCYENDKTRWLYSPEEWDESFDYASVEEANNHLEALYNAGDYEVDENWHQKFRATVFDTSVAALLELVNIGFFGPEAERDKKFLAFGLSGSETTRTHFPRWSKTLNTPASYARFLGWQNCA